MSWNEDGDDPSWAFQVHDQTAFEESLWPTKEGKLKFASFTRELNFYGFSKLRNKLIWRHKGDLFRRGRLNQLCQIKKEKDNYIQALEARNDVLEARVDVLERNQERIFQVLEGKMPEMKGQFVPVHMVPPSPSRTESPSSMASSTRGRVSTPLGSDMEEDDYELAGFYGGLDEARNNTSLFASDFDFQPTRFP